MKRWGVIAAVAVLSALALRLRLEGLGSGPYNADEYAWSWAGVSLLSGHGPVSWSYLGVLYGAPYPKPDWIELHGAVFPVVHQWMDHPPLFALVVGGAAWLVGQHSIAQVDLNVVRVPVVVLATLSVPLTFELGRRAAGVGAGLVAAFLLAASPIAVRFGQVAEAEILLLPMFLGALILADEHWRRGSRWALFGCLALCALAVLTKVSGLTVGAAVAGYFLVRWRPHLAVAAGAASAVGLLLFAGYGAVFGWEQWVGALSAHAGRKSDSLAVTYALLTSNAGPFADGGPLLDWGWWVGLLSVAGLRTRGRVALVLLPVIVYVAFYAAAGNDKVGLYGWYRWPLFAFLYVSAGALAEDLGRGAWMFLRRWRRALATQP
jgi:4-amino-4-deoxy-L-arabinose transferase-like glycosyltransferase